MGTGYTRNDTSGNIANGKVIDATDLDGEFDAIVTAFSTSGHTHDGTAAEGGKVTKLLGTSLTLGDGTAGTDITVTFDGETSDGVLVWMEDEDYFQFNDDILMSTSEKLQFRDTGIYISSNADGDLDIVSDGTAVDSINIESAGGITLDAGTAASGVIFEDDGTEMLRIYNDSSDVYIESKVSDKDIYIRGNDGGSAVNAVVFDMSAAGLATFAGGITSTAVANTLGATSFNDANITNVGNIALDSITADGSTITITGNTTFADGAYNFNIASHDGSNGLQLGGTLVTATAAELNIIDGGTSASSVTVADADRVVFNDGGTMKQVAVTDLAAYFDDEITAMPNLVTTAATTVGALNSGSITSGFGTIDTGSSTITTTGLISGGSLDIDDVLINGTTIGHTDDTDLITLADGVVTVAGEISVTTLDIGGTNVTSTAAEINILDGVTSTAAEINILDGDTSASSVTVADADRVVLNDNGTMKQVAASDIKTYIGSSDTAGQLSAGTSNTAIGANALDSMTGDDADFNSAFGANALTALTVGDDNVAIGYNALSSSVHTQQSVAVGSLALENANPTDGGKFLDAVAVGYKALNDVTTGRFNVGIGHGSAEAITEGENNSALGFGSMQALTTGGHNVAIGAYTLYRGTDHDFNTAVGGRSMIGASGQVPGDNNSAIGYSSLGSITTGSKNTVNGSEAGGSITSGSNNLALGYQSGLSGSPGGAQTTGSNEIFLGDENISAANIQVDWTVASDQRDKTDFTALDIGLDFVNALKPYTYKWDKRIKYVDKTNVTTYKEDGSIDNKGWELNTNLNSITHDGTHKEDWLDIGFKAQEVETLEKAAGYKIETKTNLTTSLTKDGKQYGIQYNKFIPILVKAVQELSAKNIALEARVKTLEG